MMTRDQKEVGNHYLRYVLSLSFILLIAGFDQDTKNTIVEKLADGRTVEVTSWFKLVLVHNPGAAFGVLAEAGAWAHYYLVSFAVLMMVLVMIWLWREVSVNIANAAALTLIGGGALGNLTDRFRHGHVIDFFVLHYESHYFPAFNVADLSITFGALTLVSSAFGIWWILRK